MSLEHKFTPEHVGHRVQYTRRDGSVAFGTIREVLNFNSNSADQVDVAIDGANRARYYVPDDMLVLLPKDHPEYKEA